jgi:hypothetical protein
MSICTTYTNNEIHSFSSSQTRSHLRLPLYTGKNMQVQIDYEFTKSKHLDAYISKTFIAAQLIHKISGTTSATR